MLDVALFDTYRNADPLFFDEAEEYIDQVKRMFERECVSPTPLGDRAIYYALHFALTPLLHTEHQRDAARLAERIIGTWDKRTWANVMPVLRLDRLRQMVLAPRLVMDSSAMSDLRTAAAKQASRQADQFKVDLGGDSPSYFRHTRNLVLAMRYDEAADKMSRDSQAARVDDDRILSDFTNFISYAYESSLNTDLVVSAERHFTDIDIIPTAFQYLAMCRRLAQVDRGLAWINKWRDVPAHADRRLTETVFYGSIGRHDEARAMGARVLSTFSSAHRTDKFGKVHSAILYRLTREVQSARFFCEIGEVRDNVSAALPQVKSDNKTSLILVPAHVNFTLQMPLHSIEVARRQGAEVSCMVGGMYSSGDNLHPATALLDQALVAPYFFRNNLASHRVSSDWIIDLAGRSVVYKGVDYYPGLMNSLGIIFRRFTIDFDDLLVRAQLDRHLVMFQSAHDLFDEFLELSDPARQYLFAVVGIQYGIGYAIRRFIERAGADNIRILHVSNGFEGFDAEWRKDDLSGNATASYHSVMDLTGRPKTPLGFRPAPPDVEAYYASNAVDGQVYPNSIAAAYIQKVRSRYENARQYPVGSVSSRPTRTVMMLGTILPDLSIPEDRGFIHDDILHWVKDTVRICEENNIRLLIKQHPAETNHKIGYYVAEKFADLVPKHSNAVEALPYEANFYSVLKACDLVTMWAGTSAIELALLQAPFVCCSMFANEEYPLGVRGPESNADYEDILTGRREWLCPPEASALATSVLNMTTSSPFRERATVPKRQLLNAQVWPPVLDPATPLSDEIFRLANRLMGQGSKGRAS